MKYLKIVIVSFVICFGPVVAIAGPLEFKFFDSSVESEMVDISASAPEWETQAEIEAGGEAYLVMELYSRDTSWSSTDMKAVVLRTYVDDQNSADIVVFGGKEVLEYSAYAGTLEPGTHKIRTEFDEENSPAPEGSAMIVSAKLVVVPKGAPEYEIIVQAPIIYLMNGKADNDIPLVLFYQRSASETGERGANLSYQVVMSNEDGGTGTRPPQLVAEWGRATDIEQIFWAEMDEAGTIKKMQLQGEGHKYRDFGGSRVNGHPVFRVCTSNGMFCDEGKTAVKLGLLPVEFVQGDRVRDSIMDEFPWIFRISNEEMYAEGKVAPKGQNNSAILADARSYVYIDYTIENLNGKKTLEFLVRLKGKKKTYSSDPKMMWGGGEDAGRFNRTGTYRTAVKLPRGASAEDIEAIIAAGSEDVDYVITKLRAFMLGGDYIPGTPLLDFNGEVKLNTDKRRIGFEVH